MSRKTIVLEGSQCLELEHDVGAMDDHPLWTCKYLVEGPEHIKSMHKRYLQAGTDVLESLSYQVSIDELKKIYNVSSDKAEEIIQSSVRLAREAWNEHAIENPGSKKAEVVAGSVGPYGALQHDGSEYTGTYVNSVTTEDLINWHRPRVQCLVSAGVDFLSFETFPSVVEALAVIRLLREFPNQKAWISFTCKDGLKTAYGESFGEAVSQCCVQGGSQILAVGCNCTNPTLITDLLQSASESTKGQVPLVVYPNSGEIFEAGKGWTGCRMDLGLLAHQWLEKGAKYIGGCCRTDVQDIRSIRLAVDNFFHEKEN